MLVVGRRAAGSTPTPSRTVLADEEGVEALAVALQHAADLGITAVPTFVIDSRVEHSRRPGHRVLRPGAAARGRAVNAALAAIASPGPPGTDGRTRAARASSTGSPRPVVVGSDRRRGWRGRLRGDRRSTLPAMASRRRCASICPAAADVLGAHRRSGDVRRLLDGRPSRAAPRRVPARPRRAARPRQLHRRHRRRRGARRSAGPTTSAEPPRSNADGVDAFLDRVAGAAAVRQPAARRLAARRAPRQHRRRIGVEPAPRRDGRPAVAVAAPRRRCRCRCSSSPAQLDAKFAAIAERMATLIPNATVAIVAGAGHVVHLERPDRVPRHAASLARRQLDRRSADRASGHAVHRAPGRPSSAPRRRAAGGRSRRALRSAPGRSRHRESGAPAARRRAQRARPISAAGRHAMAATTTSDERGGDEGDVQPPRPPVTEAHGERALARRPVGRDVAQVVDDEQGAGHEPGGAPDRRRSAR